MYAPSFAFPRVEGAVAYRFTVIDDCHVRREWKADNPTDSLSSVWESCSTGWMTVVCDGIDEKGALVRHSSSRTFWKKAPFAQTNTLVTSRACRETARRIYDYVLSMPSTRYLLAQGCPDPSYELNTYISKMFESLIRGMIHYADLDPSSADEALKIARLAADHLILKSECAQSPLACFPLTYDGRGERGNGYVAEKYAGQVMLIYPAHVASAFVILWQRTGERKYLEQAEGIAETYLRLQGVDGTWYLKLFLGDGTPVNPNRLNPIDNVIPLLERLHAVTGKKCYREAADRAFSYVENGPLRDWNWEGQFEDIRPTEKYVNLTMHDAVATAIYLGKRFPDEVGRREQIRDLVAFGEDQFVCWDIPYKNGRSNPPSDWYDKWFTPCALEQYDCYSPIDGSAAKMIRGFLTLYAIGDDVSLAKACALAATAIRVQAADGRMPTWWWRGHCDDDWADWMNCMLAMAGALEELAEALEKKEER